MTLIADQEGFIHKALSNLPISNAMKMYYIGKTCYKNIESID